MTTSFQFRGNKRMFHEKIQNCGLKKFLKLPQAGMDRRTGNNSKWRGAEKE